MKKFQFQSVTSPSVEIQCEKNACRTEAIKDASDNPNFPTPTPIVFDMVRKYKALLFHYFHNMLLCLLLYSHCLRKNFMLHH